MKFYSAGNFVLMSDPEKEREFKRLSDKTYGEGSYNRLVSFFFRKETDNVLKVKKDG
jgi:hypothetical protein